MLDDIIKKTKEDLLKKKRDYPMDRLGQSLAYNPFSPRDIKKYLKFSNRASIIAEIKRASPIKGILREDFNFLKIAKEYEDAKVDMLSVISEPHFFNGSLEHITQARRYTSLPILRKDFIVDEYQILEALVYGADGILLIARILSLKELKRLTEYAFHIGLEVLIEIHDKRDLKSAILAGCNIIGINNRNLKDFSIDLTITKNLIKLIPRSKIKVSESGIDSKDTIDELTIYGVDAFLIGEYFMKSDSISSSIKSLKEGFL